MKIVCSIQSDELRSRMVAACVLLQADLLQMQASALLQKPTPSNTWVITDFDLPDLRRLIAHVRQQGLDPGRMLIRLIDQPWYEYCYHDIPIFASLVRPPDAMAAAEVIAKLLKTKPFEQQQQRTLTTSDPFAPQFVRSPPMQRLMQQVRKISHVPIDTVLLGPTGAGKDTLAQWLHQQSERKGAFVHLNCAALPDNLFEAEVFGVTAGAYTGATKDRPGKIELANQGTLYLDEIDSLSLTAQAKLLNALQYRGATRLGGHQFVQSDFRVIVSTKVDLEAMVSQGRFRQDLHFRLSVSTLHIPPLHQRLEDLIPLYQYFLKEGANQFGLPVPDVNPDQQDHLLSQPWVGNVRELRAFAQRHVIGLVDFGDASTPQDDTLKARLLRYERALIAQAMARHQGSVKLASLELGLAQHALYYRIKKIEDELGSTLELSGADPHSIKII